MKLKYLAGIFLLTTAWAQGAKVAKNNFGAPAYTTAGWDNQFVAATSFPGGSKTISWSDSGSFTLTLSTTGDSSNTGTAGTGAVWNGNIPEGTAGDEAKGSIYARTRDIVLTFTGLAAGVYDLSLLAARGNNNVADTQFILGGSSESLDDIGWETYRNGGSSWGSAVSATGASTATETGSAGALGMNTEASKILVGADGTLTLTIKYMGTGSHGGNNVALNFMTLERTGDLPIPEPSTAMLGLLALAGTSARRRRLFVKQGAALRGRTFFVSRLSFVRHDIGLIHWPALSNNCR